MSGRLLLALVALAAPSGQSPVEVTGRVVRVVAGDTVAAAGALVTLHRVGPRAQGVLDSMVSGDDGAFRFRAFPDSADVLLVSARWHGVEYFAQPVRPGVPVTVVAIDSSSSAPVSIAARHIIVGGPAPDGTRDVIDLVVVANRGERTRVPVGDTGATLRLLLPPEAANLVVGDAEFAADAFDAHGDTLWLHAPIPPGERQFFLQYQLAPHTRRVAIPMVPRPDTLSILAEEESADPGPALQRVGDEEVQGRRFLRYVGGASVDSVLVLAFGAGGGVPSWLLPLLVAILALALVVVTRRALLPRSSP